MHDDDIISWRHHQVGQFFNRFLRKLQLLKFILCPEEVITDKIQQYTFKVYFMPRRSNYRQNSTAHRVRHYLRI